MRDRVRVFLPALPFITALGVLNLSFSQHCAGEPLDKGNESAGITLELLQAETLDAVSLDQPVHFIAPDVTDTVAGPDTYHVFTAEAHRLKLVPQKGQPALTVEAIVTSHTEDIATPIALYVTDDERFPHVVLLLPGGQGLEAIGSYDGSRVRGLRRFYLTPIQIQRALKKKLQTRHADSSVERRERQP